MATEQDLVERVHALETAQAVQAAVQVGAQATQAAIQAGTATTTATAQAGTWAVYITGGVALVTGMFLGIALRASQ